MKKLLFNNGYGGFDPQGSDYVISNYNTPSPWCNILANPNFGTIVSQNGASHTWFGNSSLFRISPKIDDSLLELSGEKLFLKNESSGKIWQPLKCAHEVRHSLGYSTFKKTDEVESEITILVSHDRPLKIVKVKVKNTLGHRVNLSAGYYLEPVLGEFSERTKADLRAYYEPKAKIICLENPGSFYYPKALMYLGTSEKNVSYTLDRTDFWGRSDQIEPSGLKNKKLSSKNIAANDLAAVIRTDFALEAAEEKTLYFYIGVSKSGGTASNDLFRVDKKMADREMDMVRKYWENLPVFSLNTPNQALNLMTNHWLLYQVLSSRVWGKTGFWQPGGAFGFRDQLQDMMALIWSEPETVRSHILLAASRQFMGGDVQHWWHPPRGDGVRSTSSDTSLWLAYTLNYYLEITGDKSILDEQVSFLHPAHKEHHPGSYFVPERTTEKATLYDHCVLAIDRSQYLIGAHGLPLILSGDWNDSLSRVGAEKKGESVWMAQFLGKIIREFIPICQDRGDKDRAEGYSNTLKKLESSLEKTWDGHWYRRAYWDDGAALGSSANIYCRIDGLTQNWSVISKMGPENKARVAMNSLEKNLINWQSGEVRLLTPSFTEDCDRDPGYINTYPPGTRENGSTYSHNAVWTALSFALLGEGNKAMKVLDILNPIARTKTKTKTDLYRGEPFVMASDIYSEGSHRGQAGWTWYTGSAALYYKTVIENILGITKRGSRMTVNPCVPSDWTRFSVSYRHKKTAYQINYLNQKRVQSGVKKIVLDGDIVTSIPLVDDRKKHEITIVMG
jgi:cyclic beta-1,2-glucan synthetase